MRARRLAGALLAIVVSLGLVGCANRPSTVFVVNGAVTTQARTHEAAASCAKSINTALNTDEFTAGYLWANTTGMIFQGQIGLALSQRLGVTYTEEELRAYLNATPSAPAYMADKVCEGVVIDYARFILLMHDLGGYITEDQILGLGITVNPRYGQFDPTILDFAGTGSLSQESPIR